MDEWDEKEKRRAELVKEEPRAFADQLLELSEWFENTRSSMKASRPASRGGRPSTADKSGSPNTNKMKGAGLAVLAQGAKLKPIESVLIIQREMMFFILSFFFAMPTE